MAEYVGLQAIARRMGMHHTTLLRLYAHQRFLMFQRRRAMQPGRKPRLVWYTNDELIARWEVAQCNAQWRRRSTQPSTPSRARAVDGSLHRAQS